MGNPSTVVKRIRKMEMCGDSTKLLGMLFLTTSYMLVELIVGNVTNSMALVADSFHMMSDVLSIIVAYVSVRISPKSWDKNTYGFARAEVVGALINAVFLMALCFSITMDSIHRFYEPEQIKQPLLILIVGGVGLAVNILGLFLFGNAGHGHSHGGDGGHGHSHGEHDEKENDHGEESGHGHSHKEIESHDHSHENGHAHAHQNGHGHSHDNGHAHSHENGHAHDHENGHGHSHDNEKSGDSSSAKKKDSASSGHQMNIHGVFLHVMSDALGSVVVMISASIIYFTQDPACQISLSGDTDTLPASCGLINWTWYIDPFLSLILVCIILVSTWPLLRDSTLILLNTVPQHIDVNDLETRLLQRVEGVSSVHELHVWRLVGSRVVASCHLEISTLPDAAEPLDYHMVLAREVKLFFHSCGIHSTTIQLEYPPSPRGKRKGEFHYLTQDREDAGCQLECPKGVSTVGGKVEDVDPDCVESSCCKKRVVRKENTDATNRALYRKETDFDTVTHM